MRHDPFPRLRRWVFAPLPWWYCLLAPRRTWRLRNQRNALLEQWNLVDMRIWLGTQGRARTSLPRAIRKDWWRWRLRHRPRLAHGEARYFLELCNDPWVPIEPWEDRWDSLSGATPDQAGYTRQVMVISFRQLPQWWQKYRDAIVAVKWHGIRFDFSLKEVDFVVLWKNAPPESLAQQGHWHVKDQGRGKNYE